MMANNGLVRSLKRGFELWWTFGELSFENFFEEGGVLITERPMKRLSAGIDPGKAAWLEVDGGESGAFSSEGMSDESRVP